LSKTLSNEQSGNSKTDIGGINMHSDLKKIKKETLNNKKNEEEKSNRLSNCRLLLFILFIILIYLYCHYSKIKTICLILLTLIVLIFIVIINIHHKIDKKIKKYNLKLTCLEEYKDRSTDDWKKFPDSTEELKVINQDLASDFNIIGENSLFKQLNVAQSIGGKQKFLNLLLQNKPRQKEILERQQAIKELSQNSPLTLDIQVALREIPKISQTNFENIFPFLDIAPENKKGEQIIGFILAFISDLIFILCLINILPLELFMIPLLTQTIISYIYLYFHNEELENLTTCSRELSSLNDIVILLKDSSFNSSKLKSLHHKICAGEEGIRALKKLENLNNLRFNFITNIIFNTTISLNVLILNKYALAIKKYRQKIKETILALEDIESYLSLTTLPLIKKNTCLPVISSKILLNLQDIEHPLLTEERCIANSFTCNEDVNIITGSNMSGKSSFMRTIGTNLILMYAGTYANAKSFTAPLLTIFSSIKVEDDLSNNISTFYGELLRIKKILDFEEKEHEPIIVFIDEIFKGTNYNDRIYGAKKIIEKLSTTKAITFITTHDFELCELKNKKVNNYHFEETYQDTNISFDYQLKEGKCVTTNAKYLMKKIGIIGDQDE